MGARTAVIFEIECDYPGCPNGFGERIIESSVFMAEEEARKRGWGKILLDPKAGRSGWCCPYCLMELKRKEEAKK